MRSIRIIAIVVLSIVALIASLGIFISISMRPPKESKILKDFNSHRATFERVRMMLSQDKGVEGVAG